MVHKQLTNTPLGLLTNTPLSLCTDITGCIIVQELCESQGGRPGLFVLMSLLVSVDVNIY